MLVLAPITAGPDPRIRSWDLLVVTLGALNALVVLAINSYRLDALVATFVFKDTPVTKSTTTMKATGSSTECS